VIPPARLAEFNAKAHDEAGIPVSRRVMVTGVGTVNPHRPTLPATAF
jgi:hypothetical protein